MHLSQELKTYENLQALLKDLDALILEVSGEFGESTEEIIKKSSPNFADFLTRYLKGSPSQREALAALTKLKKELGELVTLELSIALSPPQSFIDKIFDWVQRNVGDNIVINFKKNPSIVGGAVVSYKGKYADFSLSRQLKQYSAERQA